MKTVPLDKWSDVATEPKLIPLDFLPDFEDFNDPLAILLHKEQTGEFLFSDTTSPYFNHF